LVFIPGAGTELYRGLGAIVLFGLMFATIVTIVFLPALLVEVLSWRERRRVPGELHAVELDPQPEPPQAAELRTGGRRRAL
jgi:hypothetical protein